VRARVVEGAAAGFIMTHVQPAPLRPRVAHVWRVACTIIAILVIETIVCGMAALPVVFLWTRLLGWPPSAGLAAIPVVSLALVPSYILFALCLMGLSALTTRFTGARTPADAEMPISALGWPLVGWVRYMAAIHVVRMLAGPLVRGTPIWSWYLRLNGARVGRRVYVNTLSISDHNLLELGDDVVIGGDVHISGHTVERGVVKTGRVRLGSGVTIGLGAVIDIDVDAGARCQIGALSFVPKHAVLEADAVYAGIPVRRIDPAAPADAGRAVDRAPLRSG
jgi:acetyltransferase-like isoleucine patch superfamily enzyme